MSQGDQERRVHERFRPPQGQVVEGPDFKYMVQDISVSGMAFNTNNKIAGGQKLDISWGDSVRMRGEVLHARKLLFDSTFVEMQHSVHCKFDQVIQQSDIENLFANLNSLQVTVSN